MLKGHQVSFKSQMFKFEEFFSLADTPTIYSTQKEKKILLNVSWGFSFEILPVLR